MALFNIFWKLADDAPSRIAGCTELLTLLQAEKKQHAGTTHVLPENMQYSLKRLVRGLGSSRSGARQGFSAALTEVLLRFPEVQTSYVMELVKNSLSLGGEANKQEKKDYYLGRIFLALVLAKSDRLGKLSADEVGAMIDQLIQLGGEKPLLREACYESLGVVAVYVSGLTGGSGVAVRDAVLSRVSKLFTTDQAQWDCDTLNLALVLSTLPESALSQFPQSVRQARSKMSKYKTALTESTRVHPAVHTVWHRILDILFAESSLASLCAFWAQVVDGGLFTNVRPKCKYLGFRLFELILNRLVGERAISNKNADKPAKKKKRKKPDEEDSEEEEEEEDEGDSEDEEGGEGKGKKGKEKKDKKEKKEKEENNNTSNEPVVDASPAALKAIAALFSKHFIRTLVNNLSLKGTKLREAALHTRNVLLRAAKNRPGVALVMANHLGGSEEGANFDIRTHSKTVTLLLGQLNAEGIAEYLKSLIASFQNPVQITATPEDTESLEERQRKHTEVSRAWQIEQLYVMTKNGHLSKLSQQGWLGDILEFFLRHGYFKDPALTLSPKTRELCRQRFFTLITDLLPSRMPSHHGEEGEEKKVGRGSQFEDLWAMKAHQCWSRLAKDYELVTPLTEEGVSVRAKTLELVNDIVKRVAKIKGMIQKADKAKAQTLTSKIGKLHALQLLLLHLSLLQLKAGDLQPTQLLQEVEECYSKLFDKKEAEPESDDEPKPIEVLVDILLSLLVTESSHIREVANQVMQAFSDALTPKALQAMVAVLVSKDQARGAGGDDEEEPDDDGLEIEEDEAADEDSKADEEDEGDEDMSESEEEVGLGQLEALLAAEPEPGFQRDEAASDDDVAMDNYDKALADMMRLRKQKKNAGRDLRKLSVHFKLRVLDLLSLLVRKHPTSPLIVDLLRPMLDAFHTTRTGTDNVVLHERLLALFRKMVKPNEYHTVSQEPGCVSPDTFKSLFRELLQRAEKTIHRDDLALVSAALLFLVRMWVPLGENAQGATTEGKWVVDQYSEALTHYLTLKKSALNTKFFTEFIARFPVLGFALAEPLMRLSYTGTKEFQKLEAFALLRVLFQSKGDLKSLNVSSLGPSLGKALIVALSSPSAEEKSIKRAQVALQAANDYVTLVKRTSGKVNLGEGVSPALASAAKGNVKLKKFINNLVRNAKLDFDFSLLKSNKS